MACTSPAELVAVEAAAYMLRTNNNSKRYAINEAVNERTVKPLHLPLELKPCKA